MLFSCFYSSTNFRISQRFISMIIFELLFEYSYNI
nr:MAG TPA: hypothetical protein [Caudoviricetes sp.]